MLARTAKRRLLALVSNAKLLHGSRGREGTDRARISSSAGALEGGSPQQLAPESRPIVAANQLFAADDCWEVRELNPKLVLGWLAREAHSCEGARRR